MHMRRPVQPSAERTVHPIVHCPTLMRQVHLVCCVHPPDTGMLAVQQVNGLQLSKPRSSFELAPVF